MTFIKNQTTKTLLLFLSLLIFMAGSLGLLFHFSSATTTLFKVLYLISLGTSLVTFFILYYNKKPMLYKTFFALTGAIVLVGISYILLEKYGVLHLFESAEEIKEVILSSGNLGKFVFMLIQFTQVALIPIPALVTTLAGVAIYGAFETFILSTIAIIIGSLFAFFVLGRMFGYKLVKWIAGAETTDKYRDLLNKKGKYLFVLMLLLPVFPDDILCMIAGITTMKGKFFTIATLITRPITTFFICYFSGGQIIPYSGWGLIAWPIILILMAILFTWTYKHNEQIEYYIANLKFFKNKEE